MPAKYWRFEGGLQDAPEPAPDPAPPPPPPLLPIMAGINCFPPWMYPPYQQWPGFPNFQPPAYLQGPIYINGLQSPPPPEYGAVSPAPPDADENLPPTPPEEEKKEDTKKEKKEKKENLAAPPGLPEGCNYMFDKNSTMLHIFCKTYPVWEEKYQKRPQRFKMFKVSTSFTVKMVIENVLRKEGDLCKGWAATEAVELGSGQWAKGSTIEYDSDRSDGRLKEMAWNVKRGDMLPPVWLVVHKV